MHPILFQIGSISIHTYGVMLAVAVLVCAFLLSLDAKRVGISRDTIFDMMFWIVLGGIAAGRIFYIFIFWDTYSSNPMEMLMINHGGLAWQGGFIGGAIAGILFVRYKKLKLRQVLDLVAPYVALGQSIGRIGCFFEGCCFGKPCPTGIYFPVHHDTLYPTQLFEVVGLFVIYLILKYVQSRKEPFMGKLGMVFVLYLWLAAIERFVVEFYRADHEILALGLSLAQYIALGVFTTGVIVFMRFKRS